MIQLDMGNVLLKPSQRRQLMSWLRRALRLGERLGDFVCSIRLHRSGRAIEVKAKVHDAIGDFTCRYRAGDCRYALRELVRDVCGRLHDQYVRRGRLAY